MTVGDARLCNHQDERELKLMPMQSWRSLRFNVGGLVALSFAPFHDSIYSTNMNRVLNHQAASLLVLFIYLFGDNYTILREYIKCVLPPLTEVVGLAN